MKETPEKLHALHSGEEMLRLKSFEAINCDEDMPRHIDLIEEIYECAQYVLCENSRR